jgi:hypothetical protein
VGSRRGFAVERPGRRPNLVAPELARDPGADWSRWLARVGPGRRAPDVHETQRGPPCDACVDPPAQDC